MSTAPLPVGVSQDVPDISEIRCRTLERFGCRPCLWQCQVVAALLKGDDDIICISGTGSGKTLTFWMPLLFRPSGIQVIVTPLNILGTQNKKQLLDVGIEAVVISGDTASPENFQVCTDGMHPQRYPAHLFCRLRAHSNMELLSSLRSLPSGTRSRLPGSGRTRTSHPA